MRECKHVTSQVQHPNAAIDRDVVRAAIGGANVPTLLLVLVQLTGDLRWLEAPYQPERAHGVWDDNFSGGFPEATQAEVRDAVAAAILAWLDGHPISISHLSDELATRMLSVSLRENIPPEYGAMIALDVMASSGLGVAQAEIDDDEASGKYPDVLILGAGGSGLLAAVRMKQAGIPFTIVEKTGEVGGTWSQNRYPGVGVDTPSHLYSYSFAQFDWPRYFASGESVREYFNRVVDLHGLRDHIRFNAEVIESAYDEDDLCWRTTIRDTKSASEEELTSTVLITAVGAFNRPRVPKIAGADTFVGPAFHTTQWPADLDLSGKRVAVIGNGATSMQVVPAISGTARSVTVFQRSPQWATPYPKFMAEVPESERLLFAAVPLYYAWYRARISYVFGDRLHSAVQKDPAWEYPDRSINSRNDRIRAALTQYIVDELGDRRDLLPKVLPTYPPMGKRLLLDHGWYRTLRKPNVTLVTEPIREITTDAVVTGDGEEHEVDVLVYSTGFDVIGHLATLPLRGRGGRQLSEVWGGDDARAYLGLQVSGFPNLFILYGPNTQPGHGGSLLAAIESQMNHVIRLLVRMRRDELGAVEVKQNVYERYVATVDSANEQMIWTHPGMSTYYRNSAGRVVVNSPFRIVDYWRMCLDDGGETYNTWPRSKAAVSKAAGDGATVCK
jgi:4-hydroxyacetophenone monooxygenase